MRPLEWNHYSCFFLRYWI